MSDTLHKPTCGQPLASTNQSSASARWTPLLEFLKIEPRHLWYYAPMRERERYLTSSPYLLFNAPMSARCGARRNYTYLHQKPFQNYLQVQVGIEKALKQPELVELVRVQAAVGDQLPLEPILLVLLRQLCLRLWPRKRPRRGLSAAKRVTEEPVRYVPF